MNRPAVPSAMPIDTRDGEAMIPGAACMRALRAASIACPVPLLEALGPVLCGFPAIDPDPLLGFMRARSIRSEVRIDSDGLYESLCFYDARGQCVWRLYRLPDSDFLAWERLQNALPPATAAAPADQQTEPTFRLLSRRLRPRWQACALRLRLVHIIATAADCPCLGRNGCGEHSLDDAPHPQCWLGATPVPISPLGARLAARIAR